MQNNVTRYSSHVGNPRAHTYTYLCVHRSNAFLVSSSTHRTVQKVIFDYDSVFEPFVWRFRGQTTVNYLFVRYYIDEGTGEK